MTSFAGQKKSGSKKIVYKTKSLQRSIKGRILVGQVCTRGVQKKNIIEQINSLLQRKSGLKKYSSDSNKSRAIKNIYGKTDIAQNIEKLYDTNGKKLKNKTKAECQIKYITIVYRIRTNF